MLGPLLGTGDVVVSRTEKNSCPYGTDILLGRDGGHTVNNRIITIYSTSDDDKCRGDNENKQEGWGVGEGFKIW